MYEYRGRLVAVHDDGILSLLIDLGFHLNGKFRIRLYGVKLPSPASFDIFERRRAATASAAIYAECADTNLRIRTHRTQARDGLFTAEIFFLGPDGKERSLTESLVKSGHAERAGCA